MTGAERGVILRGVGLLEHVGVAREGSSRLTKGSSRSKEGAPSSGIRRRHEALDPGPYSDEPQMETHAHMMQVMLLLMSLHWWWRGRRGYFASGNLSIYYPTTSTRTGKTLRRKLAFRGPDFFVVLHAKPKPRRNSWVVENEDGKYPDVIVEVISPSTRTADRVKKKEIYEQVFKTPEYFLFDPTTCALEGYRLSRGKYAPIKPDEHGHLPSRKLGLCLGLHPHLELDGDMARFFTLDGDLVPIALEAAEGALAEVDRETTRAKDAEAHANRVERERDRAVAKLSRAEQEKNRAEAKAERLAAKLRALGIDPDTQT